MNHLDVPTVFLNGNIDECVFMEIPENSHFKNCENKVLRLKKAMYGLKQSARAWYIKVESTLLKLGFKKSEYGVSRRYSREAVVFAPARLFLPEL